MRSNNGLKGDTFSSFMLASPVTGKAGKSIAGDGSFYKSTGC
jgi:hypothetical protein